MFGKLMKYEMKSLSKGLIPLYGAVIVMSILNRILWAFDMTGHGSFLSGLPQVTAMMVYSGLCVAVGVLTIMAIVQRFYKGLLCDEGYLMFTLPAKPWQLILSKVTGATIMTILSGLVGFISIFILASTGFSWSEFFSIDWLGGFGKLFQEVPSWPLYVVELIVLGLIMIGSSILELYAAMALGHLSNRRRVAMSFLWYVVISVALTFVLGFIAWFGDATGLDYWLTQITMQWNGELLLHVAMLIALIGYIIKTAIFFVMTNTILTRKLNLE